MIMITVIVVASLAIVGPLCGWVGHRLGIEVGWDMACAVRRHQIAGGEPTIHAERGPYDWSAE